MVPFLADRLAGQGEADIGLKAKRIPGANGESFPFILRFRYRLPVTFSEYGAGGILCCDQFADKGILLREIVLSQYRSLRNSAFEKVPLEAGANRPARTNEVIESKRQLVIECLLQRGGIDR